MEKFMDIARELREMVAEWEPKLLSLSNEKAVGPRNGQNRTIQQIVGHMVDSVSNNTHRVVHLHYRESPLQFPNYATDGNNDRWIAIQHYQEEDWAVLVQLWKYSHLHYAHVISHMDASKLQQVWLAGGGREITLEAMVIDFPCHFRLHVGEIEALMQSESAYNE